MLIETFIEHYLQKSKIAREAYYKRLHEGSFKDFEEAKYLVGLGKGLAEADNIIRSLYKMMDARIDFKERNTDEEPERY